MPFLRLELDSKGNITKVALDTKISNDKDIFMLTRSPDRFFEYIEQPTLIGVGVAHVGQSMSYYRCALQKEDIDAFLAKNPSASVYQIDYDKMTINPYTI